MQVVARGRAEPTDIEAFVGAVSESHLEEGASFRSERNGLPSDVTGDEVGPGLADEQDHVVDRHAAVVLDHDLGHAAGSPPEGEDHEAEQEQGEPDAHAHEDCTFDAPALAALGTLI